VERIRRWLTGQVPFRCHACDWRGWRRDQTDPPTGPRGIHRELTESELDRLDPDKPTKRD